MFRCFIPIFACFPVFLTLGKGAEDLPPGELEHYREELGVNGFTAPSIDRVLRQLNQLQPLPVDKIWRSPSQQFSPDRAQLALITGAVLADGMLAISTERQSRIEQTGRALLRLAKGLGVGDRVARRSRALLELAARKEWPAMRTELIQAQGDAESALLDLKDEEIAHLIAMGGWLRGLEIATIAVAEEYTPERATTFQQAQLLAYFADRLATLSPERKRQPLFRRITQGVVTMEPLLLKPSLTLEEVERLRELAREVNRAVQGEAP